MSCGTQLTNKNARVAQLVEHDLAKVEAAGSSPVSRFYFLPFHFITLHYKSPLNVLTGNFKIMPKEKPGSQVSKRIPGFFIFLFSLIFRIEAPLHRAAVNSVLFPPPEPEPYMLLSYIPAHG